MLCYRIKEAKIPSYEKLPKEHMYYKHYMQKLEFMKMKNSTQSKAVKDRFAFEEASMKLKMDAQKANLDNMLSTNKKRIPFRERKSASMPMQQDYD